MHFLPVISDARPYPQEAQDLQNLQSLQGLPGQDPTGVVMETLPMWQEAGWIVYRDPCRSPETLTSKDLRNTLLFFWRFSKVMDFSKKSKFVKFPNIVVLGFL